MIINKDFVSMLSAILCLIVVQPVSGQETDRDSSFVLYNYEGEILRDSNWGKIAAFQRALSDSLRACEENGIATDGLFGPKTQDGLIRILSCPGFEDLAVTSDHPLHGTVHSKLWKRLLPNTPIPTVHERAFALVLTREGTDYNDVEWNYGTRDDKSALTWGPYGATAGWGNEVRGILKRVHTNDPDLLKDLFEGEYSMVEDLIQKDADQGYEVLKPVHSDTVRRQIWETGLQKLGSSVEGREAYDWYAFRSEKWLKPNLRLLYRLIPNAEQKATEVDYAFFLDIGLHALVNSTRIDKAKEAIEAKQEESAGSLTPSERRRMIGQVFAERVDAEWQKDRRGRNVTFYVDGIGKNNLTQEEVDAWEDRWPPRLRASHFGLSDHRKYYPEFLE
ncbi:hypothetical protein [Salinibacter ruber]|jgi:hypothetical protein|uniref:hypothetical protein n=1 Tax=Salinibacter ruber TaxID=146919 RepID=UPI0020735AA2|nr:hypothetical protein [Salinibacter ruber]